MTLPARLVWAGVPYKRRKWRLGRTKKEKAIKKKEKKGLVDGDDNDNDGQKMNTKANPEFENSTPGAIFFLPILKRR